MYLNSFHRGAFGWEGKINIGVRFLLTCKIKIKDARVHRRNSAHLHVPLGEWLFNNRIDYMRDLIRSLYEYTNFQLLSFKIENNRIGITYIFAIISPIQTITVGAGMTPAPPSSKKEARVADLQARYLNTAGKEFHLAPKLFENYILLLRYHVP